MCQFCSELNEQMEPINSFNEEDASETGQDDPQNRLRMSKSSSSVNVHDHSDDVKQNNNDVPNDKSTCYDESSDQENEPSSTFADKDEIWDPPDAEIEEVDEENNMSASYDYYDECADVDVGEWDKQSSLNGLEGLSSSYLFKEEKQKAMNKLRDGKFKNLVSQLIKKVDVDDCGKEGESWVDIVTQLAWQAALFVNPDATAGKEIDPSDYVKVKCIASGSRSTSQLIKGLVFKKHAALKHMATKHENPRLLLIEGMLGPSSSGLASFNSMLPESSDQPGLSTFNSMTNQGKDNITDLIETIRECHPNVILVEKSASRDVLNEVLKLKVTVVLDMKLERLKKVSRCTGSRIFSSDNILSQELKHCDSLYFEKFVEEHAAGEGEKKPSKTLMFMEGCPTRLRCTILLKGSQSEELKKIKYVVQCAFVMAYSFILETSFLVDQTAMFSTFNFGRATDIVLADKQSTSAISDSGEETIVEGASIDGVQVPVFDSSDEESSHFQESISRSASSCVLDIPISNGFHVEECTHVKETSAKVAEIATSNGLHDKVPHDNQLEDCPCAIYDEPHMATLSAASPSISDELVNVSTLPVDLNGREPEVQTEASVPVLSIEEGPDRLEGNSKEDARKVVDDGEKDIRPKDSFTRVLDSESILVLMSNRNASRGTLCEQSQSHIKLYKKFDSLGKFLRDNLLNQSLQCKACGGLPQAHIYYYAHHNKQLMIRVKRLDTALPREREGKLWMWSRCGKCEPVKEKATKRVLVLTAARGLSLGKFLELSLSRHCSYNRLSSCGHSFQKDFLYFFGLGSMVAMFDCSRVATYTVSVPNQKLEFNSSINKDWLQQDIESVYDEGILLFTEVGKYLKKIESRFAGSNLILNGSSKAFADIVEMLKLERSEFEENIKNISSHSSVRKVLSLNRLRWEVLLEACVWDRRLQSLCSSSAFVCSTATNGVMQRQKDLTEDSNAGKPEGLEISDGGEVEGTTQASDGAVQGQMEDDQSEGTAQASDGAVQGQMEEDESKGTVSASDKIVEGQTGFKEIIEGLENSKNCTDVKVQVETMTAAGEPLIEELPCEEMIQGGGEQELTRSVMEENIQGPTSEDSVPSVSLLQESEGSNLSSHSGSHQTDSVSDPEDDSSVADKDVSKRLTFPPSSKTQNSTEWVWNSFAQIREECKKDLDQGYMPKFGHLPKFELLHSPDLFPELSQGIINEGSRLQISVSNGDYIVSDYDGEISSSVACALALMKDRNPSASDSGENTALKRATSQPPSWSSDSTIEPDAIHSAPSLSSLESHFSRYDGLYQLDSLVSYRQLHHEVTLGIAKYPIKGKYSVGIMYASEFRDLRNRCCPSELDYIASLSRCKLWDAKGGKSKSFFAKTLDDRLIIKEIKKTELESFLKFAPDYFRHLNKSFDCGNQICLAKILGIYQVTIRHAKSGRETKHDLMVQENLSFGKNISRQYDLKGALHARFTATTDGTGDVLLDQNFVNDMNSSPLYISKKVKTLLERAIWNDTTFLNSTNVMDYSLLVGVDKDERKLVCGIIDYLRQYTWDKQLETWVKTSLVVPKNVQPTIISPLDYKIRFRKFMTKNFLAVPDCSKKPSNRCKLCCIKGDDEFSL